MARTQIDKAEEIVKCYAQGNESLQGGLDDAIRELGRVLETDDQRQGSGCKALILMSKAYLLKGEQFYEQSLEYARRAVELRQDRVKPQINLGQTLTAMGDLQGAAEAFKAAVRNDGSNMFAHLSLIRLMSRLSKKNSLLNPELEEMLRLALAQATKGNWAAEQVEVLYLRAKLRHRCKDYERCLRDCEMILDLNPEHELAAYLRAGTAARLGQETTEEISRAPGTYVTKLYDTYANKFDEHLASLGYQTPKLLLSLLVDNGFKGSALGAGDLGCGTGLCTKLLCNNGLLKGTVWGVDLSEKMVKKAEELGIYTQLDVDDITSWLGKRSPNTLDLVLSSDVFVYIGDLIETFTHVARVLVKGGLFAFSTETLDEDENYRLEPTRRFTHNPRYIQEVCGISLGFCIVETRQVVLRQQNGKPVIGNLFLFRKD
mmetsp:Transcript_24580/g.39990  ORF Transcript_24580/g.39990 Transcript_24580/m.39990 type:complete len:431 (-) Transcript_24580:816-2108(-)